MRTPEAGDRHDLIRINECSSHLLGHGLYFAFLEYIYYLAAVNTYFMFWPKKHLRHLKSIVNPVDVT